MIIDENEGVRERKDTRYLLAIGASIVMCTLNIRGILFDCTAPITYHLNLEAYAAFWLGHFSYVFVMGMCAWFVSRHIWRKIDNHSFNAKPSAILWLILAVSTMIIGVFVSKWMEDYMLTVKDFGRYPEGFVDFANIYAPIFWNLEVVLVILILMRRR